MSTFWVLLGEFRDSRIQTSRFESRILESTIIRFESHESNGKLSKDTYSYMQVFGLYLGQLLSQLIAHRFHQDKIIKSLITGG